ncbi:predicted protein [Nematostella vectensis]|uniref:Integrase catalytic domain-containing protein n=1 Tax=Nematostella vectensis TaxID=45351 RepID=A7SAX3_NEMVE|nr:predicted protein [Nematostella vectensis]|eukprot:XP_001631185.1 predicted protein [Nematostella vectensis]
MKSKFPVCFSGVGKLKGNKVKLHIDDKVEPVAQPVRRLPFGYRDKVADLLKRLQEEDIIEPVGGVASRWANGLVERTNRTIEKILKIATVGKKDLQKEFRKFLVAYRSTPHTSTGCTPFSLMFGRERV